MLSAPLRSLPSVHIGNVYDTRKKEEEKKPFFDENQGSDTSLSKTDIYKKSGEKETKESDYTKDPQAMQLIAKLQSRDAEVRAHEMAHKSVGGSAAGAMSFEYQKGPDGKQYAVGGEVAIDMSSESDPKATQAKMQQVKAAALAPANPSPQDLKVASSAVMIEMKAKSEELKVKEKEVKEKSKDKAVEAYKANMPQQSNEG